MTKNFDDVKKLGFGLMRLPQKEGVIDVERVKTMVDMFLDADSIISTPPSLTQAARTR